MIPIPPEIEAILTGLRAGGYEARCVGGCVRDSLLGLTPGDWDICTSALPEEVVACFGEENTIPTGLRHGTVTVRSGSRVSEVTTYRTDGAYSDHRRPDSVRFVSSLAEDLGRRDFTVNAMALDESGRVVDLFGGQADLAAGLIRCVGAPERRFREDALRILRALRFAARLGFSIEAETGKAMLACRGLLHAVSPERVFAELRGFLSAPKPGRLAESFAPVLAEVLPGLGAADLAERAPALDAAPVDFALRAALLCTSLEAPAAEALGEALRFDNKTKSRFAAFWKVLREPLPRSRGELLATARLLGWEDAALFAALPGKESFAGLLAAAKAEELPLRVSGLALGGTELLAMGAKPGPEIGEMLEALLAAVWEGRAENTAGSLLAPAEKLLRCRIDSCGAVTFREGAAGTEALLIYHRKGWGFPKGHIRPGETEEACAAREVLEETGISIRPDPGFRRETISERQGDKRKVIFLLGRYAGGEPRPQPGETRAAAWFPAEAAAGMVYYPGDRAIYLAALEYYLKHR
ncbi:MAG: NUDIX domain-containing protein [Oscillospiraceae bacterium]|nr:NUDIX domain-containing protein [Oscillospiraceae bacterium]